MGTLLWSRFNGDPRLNGPSVDEMMCSIGDLVDLMASGDGDAFEAAALEAQQRGALWAHTWMQARRASNNDQQNAREH